MKNEKNEKRDRWWSWHAATSIQFTESPTVLVERQEIRLWPHPGYLWNWSVIVTIGILGAGRTISKGLVKKSICFGKRPKWETFTLSPIAVLTKSIYVHGRKQKKGRIRFEVDTDPRSGREKISSCAHNCHSFPPFLVKHLKVFSSWQACVSSVGWFWGSTVTLLCVVHVLMAEHNPLSVEMAGFDIFTSRTKQRTNPFSISLFIWLLN